MSKEIIKTKGITVIITNSKIADRIFKTRDQNICAKEAMLAVVKFWGSVFLPQRFDKNNAKYLAHVTRQWDQAKKRMLDNNSGTKDGRSPVAPQPQDLVFTGKMRKAVLNNWRPSAISTNVKPRGRVAMPTDHAIKANISRVLKHVPAFEYSRLEEVFKAAFNKAIAEGEARQSAAKKGKADVREAKKAATRAKREARTAARREAASVTRAARGADRRAIGKVLREEKRQAKFSRKNSDRARKNKIKSAIRDNEREARDTFKKLRGTSRTVRASVKKSRGGIGGKPRQSIGS